MSGVWGLRRSEWKTRETRSWTEFDNKLDLAITAQEINKPDSESRETIECLAGEGGLGRIVGANLFRGSVDERLEP